MPSPPWGRGCPSADGQVRGLVRHYYVTLSRSADAGLKASATPKLGIYQLSGSLDVLRNRRRAFTGHG